MSQPFSVYRGNIPPFSLDEGVVIETSYALGMVTLGVSLVEAFAGNPPARSIGEYLVGSFILLATLAADSSA